MIRDAHKTPLLEVRELRDMFGLPNLYVKDESKQPFGTWKDRRSRMIVAQAEQEGVDRLVMITSGNAGYSLARFAEGTGIGVSLVVDNRVAPATKRLLRSVCDDVIVKDLSQKVFSSRELVELCRKKVDESILDVTNGFEQAFMPIIDEVRHLQPDYVICPVGSGEGFVGLHEGIKKYGLRTRLVGVAPKYKISLADKLTTPWTPYARRLSRLRQGKHRIVSVAEKTIAQHHGIAKKFLDCEPSSAIALAALRLPRPKTDAVVVLINTGRSR